MEISCFEQLWNGTEANKEALQTFWDSRAEEFNANTFKKPGGGRLEQTLDFLLAKGMIDQDSNIIDIGCGPGKYVIEFAKHAKHVTGIDLSPRMIDFAAKNAGEQGVANVSLATVDWEQVDLEALGWEKKFDLVFASMSPAINSRSTLEKMLRASKRYCFFSNFVTRVDRIKNQLSRIIEPEKRENDFANIIYCSFNILWLMGFYPEITYWDTEWERELSLEQSVEYYCSHFAINHNLSPQQKEAIADYLAQAAENGFVNEKVKAKIAWMYWKVNE